MILWLIILLYGTSIKPLFNKIYVCTNIFHEFMIFKFLWNDVVLFGTEIGCSTSWNLKYCTLYAWKFSFLEMSVNVATGNAYINAIKNILTKSVLI